MIRSLLVGMCLLWDVSLQGMELIWKRTLILEQDLARALSVAPGSFCFEADVSCLGQVHRYALGDNDAIGRGQFSPIERPSQLSTIAVERVISRSCLHRIHLDQSQKQPTVFRYFSLQHNIQDVTDSAVRQQIRELYRRFLVREPGAEEAALLVRLGDKQQFGHLPASDLAHALCLAVGTQLEFLFF